MLRVKPDEDLSDVRANWLDDAPVDLRKAGNRVRITAQLIDAGSGGHLWAERFDRDLTDIFSRCGDGYGSNSVQRMR
jgi:hypothetical protein